MSLSDTNRLVVQVFNDFQGVVDAGILWNDNFDRVISILDIHISMMDLAVHARAIDGELVIMMVTTDDFIISTKSKKMWFKVVDHLKQ